MRIDKYLKLSRIIKRRSIAKEACDAGRVSVSGKTVKSSYQVGIGDIIEIKMGTNPLKIEVIKIAEHVLKDDASELYAIVK